MTISNKLALVDVEQNDDSRIQRYKCDVLVDLAGDDADCTLEIPQQVRITQIDVIETYDDDELVSKLAAVKWLAGQDLRQEMDDVKISDDSAVIATLEELLGMMLQGGEGDLQYEGTAYFDIDVDEDNEID